MNKSNTNIIARRTKQREAILKVLKATDTHPTAQWIYEQVRRELQHISLGTVYQDLKLLKQNGEIEELKFCSNQSRFDGNTGKHSHFCCLKCNGVFDIKEPVDIVNIFRKSDQIMPHAHEALRLKPKVFWMQLNIENNEAAKLLAEAGIDVVMNMCIKVEHERLCN